MEIEWKESAHLSLSLTLKYVSRKFSDRVARQVGEKIFEKVSLLRENPCLGKVVPSDAFRGSIRYLVVHKRSKIFYVLGEDKIFIILSLSLSEHRQGFLFNIFLMELFLIVNVDWFFLSHRKDIALAASKAGYEATVVAKDTGKREEVERLGLRYSDLPIQPTGMNLWEEWKTFYFLYRLYRNEKPDIVHHVGLKNILWGSLAAKFARIKGVANAVSGLGIMFSQERKSVLAQVIIRTLRFAHNRRQVKVIFRNREDRELFLNNGVIREENCFMTKGSGVDLKEYAYTPEPVDSKIRILFAARMVGEKGVLEISELPFYPDEAGGPAGDADAVCQRRFWSGMPFGSPGGNSEPVPLMEFIGAIGAAAGREAVKDYLPMQPGDVYRTNADTSKLEDATGGRPSVGIREGVRRYVEWYKGYYR